ncbi:MAG: hypothetical protein H0U85_08775, partial [Gemmatimonadales bacterium]|nr:hypothetical protein [Gemmatimonadales bacterium]
GAIAIEFHGTSRADIGFDELMATRGFAIHDNRHTTLAVRTGNAAAAQH